ncbi:MAG: NADH-quinone oxidoreductase subunit I [Elusimicrobia bacterium]|nr:NADH-quinone oxidoreductase subunit I [Elusimicrobiota bacterium]
MTGYFHSIWIATADILKGMRVTLVTMLKPAVTVQYPDEKLLPFEAFRGALAFDAETCIACGLCAKACPSECIALESLKNEAGKRVPKLDWYSVDFGKCNFCRLCEEACPTKPKSVRHSLDYELVFDDRGQMTRFWKKGFPAMGRVFDPQRKEFVDPEGHLRVQGGEA